MSDDEMLGDRMAREHAVGKRDHRRDLRGGKQAIAELVTRIDDLDPDRPEIDVGRARIE